MKSLWVAGGKIITKTAFKTVSHSWKITRRWLAKTGQAEKGQHVHHWLLRQKEGIGKYAPEWLKNQPWNLMPMKSPAFHQAIHGKGPNAFNIIGRLYFGIPQWFKASFGYGINTIENGTR